MTSDVKDLAYQLSKCLNLNCADQQDDGNEEIPLNELLLDILSSYHPDGDFLETNSISEYVYDQLPIKFADVGEAEDNFNTESEENWLKLLSSDFDCSVKEFSISLYILLNLSYLSLINKQKLGHLSTIKGAVRRIISSDPPAAVATPLSELYINILSVSCNTSDLQHAYEHVKEGSDIFFSFLNTLGNELSDPYSQSYLSFDNCSQVFEVKPSKPRIAAQLWVVFNNVMSNRIISFNGDLFVEVKQSVLCISDHAYILAMFEGFEFSNDILYGITLNIYGDSFSLYVDGSHVDTISLPQETARVIRTVELGSMICSLKVFKFWLWSERLYEASIRATHCLPLLQVNPADWPSASKRIFDDVDESVLHEILEATDTPGVTFGLCMQHIKQLSINHLMASLNPRTIIDKSSDPAESFTIKLSAVNEERYGKCLYYKSAHLLSCFQAVGALNTIMDIIYACNSLDNLHRAVEHLLVLLKCSSVRKVFESTIGYTFLGLLLSKEVLPRLHTTLSIQFLDLFLSFCGWDLMRPSMSIMRQSSAYASLVMNFELWISPDHDTKPKPSIEMVRYLLFQLNEMLQSSKFADFSAKQLKKIKILDSLICYQHLVYTKNRQDNFLDDLQSELIDILKTLIKSLSQPEISALFHFAFYEVRKELEGSAIVVLHALKLALSDCTDTDNEVLAETIYSAIPVKVILMTLESARSSDVVIPLLEILTNLLQANPNSHRRFTSNNGFRLLFDILKDQSMDRFESIIVALITNISFRLPPKYELTLSDLSYRELTGLGSTFVSDSHCLVLDLIEWAVINDVSAPRPADIIEFVMSYFALVVELHEVSPNFGIFNIQQSPYLEKMIDLLMTLNKPRNGGIYRSVSEQVTFLLTGTLIHQLSYLNTKDFTCRLRLMIRGKKLRDTRTFREEYYWREPFLDTLQRLESFIPAFEAIFQQSSHTFSNLANLLEECTESASFCELSPNHYIALHKIIAACAEYITKKSSRGSGNTIKDILSLCENKTLLSFFISFQSGAMSADSPNTSRFVEATLYHQSSFFGADKSHKLIQLKTATLFLATLSNSLKASRPLETQTAVLNCIRIIILHHSQQLSEMSHLIDRSSKSVLSDTFQYALSASDEDLLNCLSSTDITTILNNYVERQLKKHFKREIPFTAEAWAERTRINSLLDSRETALESRYREITVIHNTFKRDSIKMKEQLISSEDKKLLHFLNDKEDEAILFYQQFRHLRNTVKNILRVHDIEQQAVEWNLDPMEDRNRMRRRLVPKYISTEAFEQKRDEGQANFVYSEVQQDRASQEMKANSTLSFEVISELDALNFNPSESHDKNRKVLKILEPGDCIKSIWNCSNIIGLNVHEGVLILGKKYIYFMANYFYSFKKCKVMDLWSIPAEERDPAVKLILGSSSPQPTNVSEHTVQRWELLQTNFVTKRPFLLRDLALELSFDDGKNCFFTFHNKHWRDDAFEMLSKCEKSSNMDAVLSDALEKASAKSEDINIRNGLSHYTLSSRVASVFSHSSSSSLSFEALRKWQNGEISNFYYLIVINTLAGRTFNDITQYPVFPWVIADYTSDELNLDDPNTYRDLGKPMGAQAENRRQQFIERFNALESLTDGDPAFHYGTHYSSAMIVSSFLMRLSPFVHSYLLLQGGKFGHADRLFNSIERTWCSASSENTTDVRELIPEFYYLPDFLKNINKYRFGALQTGEEVNDVILPPWAKGDPKLFVEKNREALESTYVSERLHEWIDLIFGYKQKGQEAVKAINVFNRLSYPGAVNLDEIDDENERVAVTGIIHNFGQTPLQMFDSPHPQRRHLPSNKMTSDFCSSLASTPAGTLLSSYPGPTRHIKILSKAEKGLELEGFPSWCQTLLDESSSFVNASEKVTLTINGRKFLHGHHCLITFLEPFKAGHFFTSDESGLIKHWEYRQRGTDQTLTEISQLVGHMWPIRAMYSSRDYNMLLSVDESGLLFAWDILDSTILRRLCSNARNAAISNDSGTIAFVDTENIITVCDINGSVYVRQKLEGYVSSIGFFDRGVAENHSYFRDKEILAIGREDGNIDVIELRQAAPWKLILLTTLSSEANVPILCVQMLPLSEDERISQDARAQVSAFKLMAGSEDGTLHFWR